MDAYLEHHLGKKRKFWRVEVDGSDRTITQGGVDAKKPPTSKSKTFKTADAAAANFDKEVAKKLASKFFDPTSLESLMSAHAAQVPAPTEAEVQAHREEFPHLCEDYLQVFRSGALGVGTLNDFGKPATTYPGSYSDISMLHPACSAADHIDDETLDPYFYLVGMLFDGATLVQINQGKWAGQVSVLDNGPGDDMSEFIVQGDPDATIEAWIGASLMEPLQESTLSAFVLDRLLHHKGAATELLVTLEKATAAVGAKIEEEAQTLEKLDLSDMSLTVLPDSLGDCVQLRTLNLHKNKFKNVPPVVRKLKRLEHLDMHYNDMDLAQVPEWVRELPLRSLDLSINYHGEGFPNAVTDITTLEELKLAKVDRLPAEIANLRKLRSLTAGGVKEGIEDQGLTQCTALETLHLGRLSYPLPGDIGNLSGLMSLRFDSAWQEEVDVPNSLTSLSKLKELRVGGARLPEGLGALTALESLHIQGNDDGLPASFGELKSLKKLDLHYYRGKTLPENFGELQNLEWLNLEAAQFLETLPESFSNLRSLRYLSLAACRQVDVGDRLAGLVNLEQLVLTGSWAESAKRSVAGLTKLKKIKVY